MRPRLPTQSGLLFRKICRDIRERNRFLAVKRQSLPRNVAETELQAYTKHRDLLKEVPTAGPERVPAPEASLTPPL